jgi:hypothetical protein
MAMASYACRKMPAPGSVTSTAVWAHELRISGGGSFLDTADGRYAWATIPAQKGDRLAVIDDTGRVVAASRTELTQDIPLHWTAYDEDGSLRLWHTENLNNDDDVGLILEESNPSKGRQIDRRLIGKLNADFVAETPAGRYAWVTARNVEASGSSGSIYRVSTRTRACQRIGDIPAQEAYRYEEVAAVLTPTVDDDLAWLTDGGRLYCVRAKHPDITLKLVADGTRSLEVWPIDNRFAWTEVTPGDDSKRELYLVDAAGQAEAVLPNETISELTSDDDDPSDLWLRTSDALLMLAIGSDAKPRIARRIPISDVTTWSVGSGVVWAVVGNSQLVHVAADGTTTRASLPVSGDVESIVLTGDEDVVWLTIAQTSNVESPPGTAVVASATKGALAVRSVLGNVSDIITVARSTHALLGVPRRSERTSAEEFDPDYYGYDAGGKPLSDEPLFDAAPVLTEKIFSDQTSWLGSEDGLSTNYIVGTGRYVTSAVVQFSNGAVLRYPATKETFGKAVLTGGRVIDNVRLMVGLANNWTTKELQARVKLTAFDDEGRVVGHSPLIPVAEFVNEPVQLSWRVPYNRPCTILLSYQDRFTPRAEVRWSGVVFTKPLFQEPWFRTAVAFLLVLVLGAGLLFVRIAPPAIRTWLPLMMLALANAGAFTNTALRNDIDGPVLAGLTSATILMGVVCSFMAPSVLRILARAQPFQLLLAVMLNLPAFRRRFFSGYATDLDEKIRQARAIAHQEQYVAVPARLNVRNGNATVEPRPADALAAFVTGPASRACHTLIEAEGGRGKSALLRELVRVSLERFRRDGRVLPVICDGKTDSMPVMLRASLGKYAVSETLAAAQLDAGHFALFLDGVSESAVTPGMIESFVRSEAGEQTPLVVASRPRDDVRASVKCAERWVIAEPEKLTDQTYPVFETAYVEIAEENRDPRFPAPQRLSPAVKAICRGRDGGYSPILVRLAILVGTDDVADVSELYALTFDELFARSSTDMPPDVFDEAARLCVDTYWTTGHRPLAFLDAPEPRKKLLRALLDAGILMNIDIPRYSGAESAEVRFFHDSMQTYLAAKGLLADEKNWPSKLIEAAGDVRFREALRDDTAGPEIFDMCLNVFRPQERLRSSLASDLESWASDWGDLFSIRIIRQAAPPSVRAFDSVNPADALRSIVARCRALPDPTAELSHVYIRLAPIVWEEMDRAKRTKAKVDAAA